jgi:hypothetical protein
MADRGSIPDRAGLFCYHYFQTVSGATQPPIHWVSSFLPQGLWPGPRLTAHLHVVTKLKMCSARPYSGGHGTYNQLITKEDFTFPFKYTSIYIAYIVLLFYRLLSYRTTCVRVE